MAIPMISQGGVALDPSDLVAGIVELASPPEIYLRITQLLDDPASSSQDFARILQEDPALTARLLKIVNSAFYGFPSQVSSVSRAITLVGMRELRDLVLTATVMDTFNGLPNELVSIRSFWEESLRCAVLSRLIAERHEQGEMLESMLIAGLLHEIGHLVLYRKLPELIRECLLLQQASDIELYAAERQVIGFDYAVVSGTLLRKWRLPESLCDAIEFHIDPDQAGEQRLAAMMVSVARKIGATGLFDYNTLGAQMNLSGSEFKSVGLREGILMEVLEQAELQYKDMLALML